MKLSQLERVLEELFPFKNALKDDITGLQVNCGNRDVNALHIAYELNNDVVNECINNSSQLLLVFHPLIYRMLKSVDINDRVGEILIKLIKNNISLYVVHTIYDTNPNGTNHLIARQLGLNKISNLVDIFPENDIGMGFVGEFESEITLNDLLIKCKEIFNSPIKYTSGKSNFIRRIAIVGGSGSSFADEIFNQEIDAFITADNTYHTFHRFKDRIALIDPGHYEMEKFVVDGIYEYLHQNTLMQGISLNKSQINTNPVNYYIENKF